MKKSVDKLPHFVSIQADAISAIMKLDKQMLNNRPVNVALSNPPARKVQPKTQPSQQDQQPYKPKVQEIHGRLVS